MSGHEMSTAVEITAWGVQIVLIVALFLAFFRLVRGPSLPDRVIALDLIGAIVVGLIAAYSITMNQSVFVDAAIVLALIVFLGTVAFARFVERQGMK